MHCIYKGFLIVVCAASVVAGGCAGGKNSSITGEERAAVAERPAPLAERIGNLFRPATEVKEIPAGTAMAVRFVDGLSSETTGVGRRVRAEVARPVTVDGVEAIPDGSTLLGDVTVSHPPKIGGRAALAVSFHTLQLTSGKTAPVEAVVSWRGKSEKGKDAATIAGSVIGGAILGHQVDADAGKIVGGIVGGAAGTAIAHKTHGKPLVIPAGTVIELRLAAPVRVEVRAS